jgi:hypothetical protein
MERTLAKHEQVFQQHPAGHAHYVRVVGISYLQAGRWSSAARWAVRRLIRDPRGRKQWV